MERNVVDLVESVGGNNPMMKIKEASSKVLKSRSSKVLEGEFARFNIVNENNRKYPKDVYVEALKRDIIPKIEGRKCLGECDHPMDYDDVRLSNVSHVVTNVEVKGDSVTGEIELLDTPMGEVLQALVTAGVPLSISSRALGDSEEDEDGVEVITDLDLITYDVVADPGFKTAVLSEKKTEALKESLSKIEKKLPLNESKSSSPVRKYIRSIRESISKPKTTKVTRAKSKKIDPIKPISKSTAKAPQVVERKKYLKVLRQLKDMRASEYKLLTKESKGNKSTTEYDKLMINHTRLQDEFNRVHEQLARLRDENLSLRETIRGNDNELLETRKQLEVERRGLDYKKVEPILREAKTSRDINERLDNYSNRSTNYVTIDESKVSNDNIKITSSDSLASLVSRL